MADYSINAVTRRVVYTGSAGVGPYAFSFEVLAATDVAVYKNATKLTLTTNYTVTINANGTGSVTLVSAAAGTDRITIIGSRAIERTADFVTAGDLLAASLNEQLDSQIVMIQQIAEENKRTLKAPQYDPAAAEDGGTVNMVLPVAASRAGKTLAFDNSGNPVVGEDIGNWRGNWAATTAYTVRDMVKDSSNSNVYRCNTAHTASGTTPISSNSDSAKWDLIIDAAAPGNSASAAADSEAAAAASASLANDWATKTSGTVAGGEYSAKHHAQAAATSASGASSSASSAASAQAAAESARDSTLAAYDQFDDRYLGAKATDPTLDNDGNALVGGALFFDTAAGAMKIWTGSAWVAAYVSGSGFLSASNNLSDLASVATARTNLELGTVATESIVPVSKGGTGVTNDVKVATIQFVIDGGGGAITTGVKGDVTIPFACSINEATLLADQSGSIVIDVWKDTYANFPPTPADTITASAKPTLSSANKSNNSTLTGWTNSIAANDVLRFNVDSAATVTRVTLALKVTRT